MKTNTIIERARTIMKVPAKSGNIVVAYPFYGPANSKTLQTQIETDKLVAPTARQVAIFGNTVYNGDEPEEQEFTRIMKDRGVRGFTGIYLDHQTQTAYLVDYPEFNKDSLVDVNDLGKRVSAGEQYAQVPFSEMVEGPIGWRDVPKSSYMKAWAHDQEGVEALAELASKHPRQEAYSWVPNVS